LNIHCKLILSKTPAEYYYELKTKDKILLIEVVDFF
jgi:hypothetical protein